MILVTEIHDGKAPDLILPDAGDRAIIAMRYKNVELAFCIKPDDPDEVLITCIRRLWEVVRKEADG